MHEVQLTVVGNVATPVECRTTPAGLPAARFRLAGTVRRFDREKGAWGDAWTSFYTVWAWRALAEHLAESVSVGQPLLVRGQLRVREAVRDGRTQVTAEILASSAGHDLARGTAVFTRQVSTGRAPSDLVDHPRPAAAPPVANARSVTIG
jgi:single-strand DNA-binding protein